MNDHPQSQAAALREQALREIAEENERAAQQVSIDRCDQCPEAKRDDFRKLSLPNGILLRIHAHYCGQQRPECTASVDAYLLNQPPEVSNQIVEWLAQQPELRAAGVGWMGCLAIGADYLLLTYRVPVSGMVEAAVAAVRVEDFRHEPIRPCASGAGNRLT